MADTTLNLVGGWGDKPRQKDDDAPKGFVYDPSAEDIADMNYDTLLDVYSAMVEYDASGGKVRRRLKRELERREVTVKSAS